MKYIGLFVFFFLNSGISFCQNFQIHFNNISVENGLISNEVYSVFEDSKGFIWLTTDQGVCMYTGYGFKSYSTNSGLPDNVVFGLYEDKKHRLWLRSFSGELCFIKNDSVYVHPTNDTLAMKVNGRIITSMVVDSLDNIHLGLIGGAGKSDEGYIQIKNNLEFHSMKPDTNVPTYFSMWEIENQMIFGNYRKALKGFSFKQVYEHSSSFRVKKKGSKVWCSSLRVPSLITGKYGIHSIEENKYIFAFQDNVSIVKPDESLVTTSTGKFITASGLVDGKLWLGTPEGIEVYSLASDSLTHLKTIELGFYVTSLLQDRLGGIWITSLSNGVFYSPNLEVESFERWDKVKKKKISADRIIASSKEGVQVVWSDQTIGLGQTLSLPASKRKLNIVSAFSDDNVVFFGINQKGFLELKNGELINSGTISDYKIGNILTFSKSINSNEYWIGSILGLYKFDGQNYTFDSRKLGFKKRVISVCEDNSGVVWLGTLDNLWQFNGKEFITYEGNHPFFSSRINKILKSPKGDLIFISRDNGLAVKKDHQVSYYSMKNGLPTNVLTDAIIQGDDLWVSSNHGVIQIMNYLQDDFNMINYSKKDGLISNLTTGIAIYNDSIWVSGPWGVSKFQPFNSVDNKDFYPIWISSIQINDKEQEIKNHYPLNHDQNYIQITFGGTYYAIGNNLKFKYQMEGIDKDWVETSVQKVRYSSLNPGKYVFKLMGENINGHYTETKSISFTINTPFWQKWYFYLIVMMAFLSATGLVIFNRFRTIKNRLMNEAKMAVLQKQALQAQMNPHFIFNALNSIQSFISRNNVEESEYYLAMFAKLMRAVLTSSREEEISLNNEIEALKCYLSLEQLRSQDKFEFEILFDDVQEVEFIKIPPMLIQPYVENAIIHGILNKTGHGKITINFSEVEGGLNCCIQDNGIGRIEAARINRQRTEDHKSYGVLITTERLELINQSTHSQFSVKVEDLYLQNGDSAGTKVVLNIPIYEI